MRKTALTTLILILFTFITLYAQTGDANQDYIQAMSTQDPAQKAKLLKQWLKTNQGKGNQYEKYAHAELCVFPYPGKTAEELVEYGEKALTFGGLDNFTNCRVLIKVILSRSSNSLKPIETKRVPALPPHNGISLWESPILLTEQPWIRGETREEL